MNWMQLLSVRRLGGTVDDDDAPRSPFQRDYDRVLYSSAFRRLGDKTQVFPVPLDDHIHSRLTHSLEVATIGRSLGTLAGRRIAATAGLPAGLDARDVGDCVAAACLAHDLGNPPFGHVGEDAFQEFYKDPAIHDWLRPLTPTQQLDLMNFEGNAQALRIVTRLERQQSRHGLDLTCATLGALVKYPCGSDGKLGKQGGRVEQAKHGVNQAELETFGTIADVLGMAPAGGTTAVWQRHPLAFLTEAADDITYRIIDFEDGLRLRQVGIEKFVHLIVPLCEGFTEASAMATTRDRQSRFDLAQVLRGLALDRLIHEVADVFERQQDALLAGDFHDPLIDHIPSREALKAIEHADIEHCYQARDVLKMELSGSIAIEGVMESLVRAAVHRTSLKAHHLESLLPDVFRGTDLYTRLLQVTDHVSGMTDNYLLRLYRELSGIRLPGGRD